MKMPENAVRWTDEQQDAIGSRGTVLVSAAAGSGKTAVLAQHVITMITGDEPVDVDKLLVLTFTRDAAAEMKKRIRDRLEELLARDPSDAALLRQKQRLYSAHISTTDSFCSTLVKENFSALAVSPDFRIASDAEIQTVAVKALDNAIEPFYAANSPDFRALLRALSSNNTDNGLRKAVMDVHQFLQNQPFREEWLDALVSSYTEKPFYETDWASEIEQELPATADMLTDKIKCCMEETLPQLPQKYADLFEPYFTSDLNALQTLREALRSDGFKGWVLSAKKLFDEDYQPLPELDKSAKKGKSTQFNKAYACREQVRAAVLENKNAEQEQREIGRLMITFCELIRAYDRELESVKARRNIRTFSDVSLLAVRLLAQPCSEQEAVYHTGGFAYRPTALAQEISKRFHQVILDEYQDVNLIQEVLYNCVSDEGKNLFMVGDVKQSIYGFRQSKAKLFSNRQKAYAPFDRNDPQYPATIFLNVNFRSRREVCDTVNYIFAQIMSSYRREEYLNPGATYPENPQCDTEIALIEKNNFSDELSVAALESKYVAGRILKLMQSGFMVSDKDGQRPLRFGDVAVLMRAKAASKSDEDSKQKGSAEFVRQLSHYGIPAYCEESENFFDAKEIRLLLNILRVIDDPANDIALLSVLMSPLFGFTPDDLTVMRMSDRKAGLYRTLFICRGDDSPTGRKCADFLNRLTRLRDLAAVSTVDELLEIIYQRTAIVAVTAAVNEGASPTKNLDLMRVYARQFCTNGYKTLSDFNAYIQRVIASEKPLPAASGVKADTADCVHVMSIHKSKGLEFPVCFLVDTARKFNDSEFHSAVLSDSEAFVGFRRFQNYRSVSSLAYRAIKSKHKRENLDEEMRMLYVALTRAREKLILVGTDEGLDDKVLPAALQPESPYEAKRLLDWILMTAAKHPSTRAIFDPEAEPEDTDNRWILRKILTDDELFSAEVTEQKQDDRQNAAAQPDYLSILRQNLAFDYPDKDIIGVPQKVSPSQVSHSESRRYTARALVVPGFARENTKAGATEIGTAHHEFLHYCDFAAAGDNLDAEISRLLHIGKLTQRQCDCLDRDKLSAILRHPLFDRVLRVPKDKVWREKQFTVFVHPSFTMPEGMTFRPDRKQIVDGELDLCFAEDDGLVIVDYKTDRVSEVEELRRHKPQLDLYEHAMKQVMNLPVKEKIVFSITLNDYITV